ncbi:UDP-3-O-(3-hydroxymyristoyl)glucosamine N-acyltransferase [Granulicella tundricola]|uniref:UDP-3-O-acylglucosamine N-acyltransferase n=1 Tax=Granulicella tundricola (strain ATCC BAA-1859 / DSM 23138 / MP5ACTX9) TaxID=1198114 RepID=E8WWY7_GRATM|nr:UDP-3-O-(3-hydroxymyristoyl)glucosamine N-acyltransferase [Granulicella tundricola]ADW68548.1 UDP-3-O-(3-hydroxymyristoyl) glucosamine N-acyltransferase [Granulicella tundricola MP5ACTX9]
MKLSELAASLGATLQGGDGETEITGIAGIEQAGAGQITFVANQRYAGLARTTKASAILVEPGFPEVSAATLRLKDPYLAFAKAIELFYQAPIYAASIHPTAVIAATATIGARAHIGAYVVVEDGVVIGEDAVLHPHVVVYPHVIIGDRFTAHAHAIIREHCRVGDDVILQNGVVIGADGFGFARKPKEAGEPGWYKIVQSGPTVIESDVEVQANACVDRASIGETRVMRGAKIDNLVQVGHGSTVGENSLLCAQVGLAGSTVIGKNVVLAGQVGVAGHCTVGDGAIATAQSGIPNDVAAGKVVSGYPAVDNRQWLRSVAMFNRLPELMRGLRGKS